MQDTSAEILVRDSGFYNGEALNLSQDMGLKGTKRRHFICGFNITCAVHNINSTSVMPVEFNSALLIQTHS